MDVNELLKLIREDVALFRRVDTLHEEASVAAVLVDRFESLDEWLSKGGFLPADWSAKRARRED